jgi:hypothetical protein
VGAVHDRRAISKPQGVGGIVRRHHALERRRAHRRFGDVAVTDRERRGTIDPADRIRGAPDFGGRSTPIPSCGTSAAGPAGSTTRCLAYPLGDGFVIAVLRGAESHWVRNVMAAGELTLRTKGRDFLVDRPEFIAPVRYS